MEINPPKKTALSSFEAEIMANNECATEFQSLNHCVNDTGIKDAYSQTKI